MAIDPYHLTWVLSKVEEQGLLSRNLRTILRDKAVKSEDPQACMSYLQSFGKGRAEPLLEPTIATHGWNSVYYATTTGRRFPAGEPKILEEPFHAMEYARSVVKGRWPEAEAIIATHPYTALNYAKLMNGRKRVKERFTAGEPAILEEAETSIAYAKNIIKGRWPEGEPYMINDVTWTAKHWTRRYAEIAGYTDPGSWAQRQRERLRRGQPNV